MAVAVALQVSAPYSKIGFTMALKILILVFVVRSEDPHIFLGWKATLAVPICTFTYVGICPAQFVNEAAEVSEALRPLLVLHLPALFCYGKSKWCALSSCDV